MSWQKASYTGTWTPGPWYIGPTPHGHCRIYAESEPHAIAKTYSPALNGIGVCELTGEINAVNAALIALAPKMAEALWRLANARINMAAYTDGADVIFDDAINFSNEVFEDLLNAMKLEPT